MKIVYFVDIILIVVAVSIVLRCWKNGLVSSVVRLVGTVAAYAGAWLSSGPIADLLYTKFVQARLVTYAETIVPAELQELADTFSAMGGNTQMLDSLKDLGLADIPALIGSYLTQTLEKLGLDTLPFPLVDTDKAGQGITGFVLDQGYTLAEAVTEVLLQPLATSVLRVLTFAVVFGLLSLLVSVLYRVGFGFNHLPLVGGINHLLGAGIGLLEAGIVLYILCMVLAMVSAIVGAKYPAFGWAALQDTFLFSRVVGVKLPAGFGLL